MNSEPLFHLITMINNLSFKVEEMEKKLIAMESASDFDVLSIPYNRQTLRYNKELDELTLLRRELVLKGVNSSAQTLAGEVVNGKFFPAIVPAPPAIVPAPPAMEPARIIRLDRFKGSTVVTSPISRDGSSPPVAVKIDPTDLPDLPRYLAAKADLSAIKRDFTDNKIYFVATDNSVIGMAQYQENSKFIKSGECPSKFMKGEFRYFKTGFVIKTQSFTENKLFFPVFYPYPTHPYGSS